MIEWGATLQWVESNPRQESNASVRFMSQKPVIDEPCGSFNSSSVGTNGLNIATNFIFQLNITLTTL